MECYTCDVFSRLDIAFTDVYSNTYGLLAPTLHMLLGSFIAIILLFKIYQAIAGKPLMFEDILTRLLIFTLVGGALLDNGATWWPLFNFLKDIGPWFGTKIINAFSDYTVTREGIPALLEVSENSFFKNVFGYLRAQADDISLLSQLSLWIGVILLSAVYLVLSWSLISGVLFSSTKIYGIGVTSPILVFFLAFEQTRSFSIFGFRLLLTAALELILASASLAVVLSLMSQVSELLLGSTVKTGVNDLWGVAYFQILVAGLFMLLIHRALISVAEQLTNSFSQTAGGYGKSIIGYMTRFIPK